MGEGDGRGGRNQQSESPGENPGLKSVKRKGEELGMKASEENEVLRKSQPS